ncbi:MAG: crosslink repair DNA glycosylase YcaQ family protein, partial [Kiloniellales bacterium]|nr:crosslink repair DNA glycosylase YcaQ family protein [Kiloniellales bacterium]
MANPPKIDNLTSRRILLWHQGLCRPPKRRITSSQLQSLIEELGFVQLDSVATVERAHHMILFSRNETYRPELLRRLLEKERSLFENWTHDASVIPSRFFPYWKPRFERDAEKLKLSWRKWHGYDFEPYLQHLLGHIEKQGPARSRDFKVPRDTSSDGWWNWHPAKTALEYLWRTGRLAVVRREGFQKVYDLTPRVIPSLHLDQEPGEGEFLDWSCREALNRLGVATAGEISAFWDSVSPAEASGWCFEKCASGEIREVLLDGLPGEPARK